MLPLTDLSELQRLRRELGISQAELAKTAKVSQSLIAKVEAGRLDPSYSNAKRIINALSSFADKSLQAYQLMTTKVKTVLPSTTLRDAAKLMRKLEFSQLPVMEEGVIQGLISEKLLLEHVDDFSKSVSAVMIPPPPMVDEHANSSVIVQLLQSYQSVLVTRKGRLVGIISKADVVQAALKRKL